MIKLHTLKSTKTTNPKRRVGRGHGSGKGKTSGRGHKGYKARSGSTSRFRFEGGQNPIVARIPKLKGFKNINRKDFKILNVSDLIAYSREGKIAKKDLIERGFLKKSDKLKILGEGEIKEKVEIETDAVSKTAKEKIEKAGGKITILETKKSTKKETDKAKK